MNKRELIEFAAARIGVSPQSDLAELERITESRCHERPGGKQYAWCGDFATYCLMCCGCHDGGALNRVALNGKWKPGQNISMLVAWAKGYQQFVDFGDAEAGDIVIFANNTGDHICFLEQPVTSSGAYTTIDGNSGNIVARNSRQRGNKPIRCCISTGMLLEQSVKPGEQPAVFPLPMIDLNDLSSVGLGGVNPTVVFPVGELLSENRGIVQQSSSAPRRSLSEVVQSLDFYKLISGYRESYLGDISSSPFWTMFSALPTFAGNYLGVNVWSPDLGSILKNMLIELAYLGDTASVLRILRSFSNPGIKSDTSVLLDEVSKTFSDSQSQYAYFDQY